MASKSLLLNKYIKSHLSAIPYTHLFTNFTITIALIISLFCAPAYAYAQEQKGIAKLKKSLEENVKTADDANTLLKTARELNYPAGQIVALCYLGVIYDKDQQAEQSKSSLRDARQLAVKVTGMADALWALKIMGTMQKNNAPLSNDVQMGVGSVMTVLGNTITKSTVSQPRNNKISTGDDDDDDDELSLKIEEQVGKIMAQADKLEGRSKKGKAPKKSFVDHWLDTLFNNLPVTLKNGTKMSIQKNNRDINKALSNDFAKKGNYAEAYKYYQQYSAYKDSLLLEGTSRRLASLQYKQNLLKKESEIKLLTKDRQLRDQAAKRQLQLMFGLFAFIALLVTVLIILSRNNGLRKKVNLKLNEQKEELQQALSELKTTQEQLIQSEKMASLGELTAGIAHEIQNPLNFVNNFSEVSAELVRELIEDRQKGNIDKEEETVLIGDIEQNLQKITEHGKRASSIIKSMLEHSRSKSGQKEPTNLNAVVEEYLKLSYHGMRAKDNSFECKLSTQLDSNVGQISIIPQEIGRVLLNIFNNAFYATQQRKKAGINGYEPLLTVKTWKDGKHINILIKDNGAGIPESVKQKIFQPFFTTKPTGQGTGLGLSLSYDVITKGHGGKIHVDSEENSFTEFTLTLPA
ncbi:MAG: ATP-binding protein [Mucilaginibacter sp.]|jgi:signal transduction histidine kinase|uniref:sensor histidine kinase n=1 Tax=Mucilaginibacter sp. TaxID=1882438 RepID=UPI003561BC20